MASQSPRLGWPYPDQNQAVWFDAFQAMVNAMDSSGYAAREDRGIIVMGGGSFLQSGDVLSWNADIELLSATTGFKSIITGPGSISLPVGRLAYVNITRAPVANTIVTLLTGNSVPSSDSALFFCIRSGNVTYFRNGRGIELGVPEAIWRGNSPAPGPGPGDFNATTTVPLVVGDAVFLNGAGTVGKADATSSSTVPVIGFSVTTVPAGPCVLRRVGSIPIALIVLVPGSTYWLDTTAGMITNSVSGFVTGNIVQELGVAFDTGNLLISLDVDWTEL